MMVFIMQCYLPASEQELVIPSTWEDVLDSFVSGHSVLVPWVEGSTFNNLQSLVQAGQILPSEVVVGQYLCNVYVAMCAFQA